jgi:hypothetical protein
MAQKTTAMIYDHNAAEHRTHGADFTPLWCDACQHPVQLPVDIAWIDDNDGCGPRKLQNSVRCF